MEFVSKFKNPDSHSIYDENFPIHTLHGIKKSEFDFCLEQTYGFSGNSLGPYGKKLLEEYKVSKNRDAPDKEQKLKTIVEYYRSGVKDIYLKLVQEDISETDPLFERFAYEISLEEYAKLTEQYGDIGYYNLVRDINYIKQVAPRAPMRNDGRLYVNGFKIESGHVVKLRLRPRPQ